jgi:hypothetical protein
MASSGFRRCTSKDGSQQPTVHRDGLSNHVTREPTAEQRTKSAHVLGVADLRRWYSHGLGPLHSCYVVGRAIRGSSLLEESPGTSRMEPPRQDVIDGHVLRGELPRDDTGIVNQRRAHRPRKQPSLHGRLQGEANLISMKCAQLSLELEEMHNVLLISSAESAHNSKRLLRIGRFLT